MSIYITGVSGLVGLSVYKRLCVNFRCISLGRKPIPNLEHAHFDLDFPKDIRIDEEVDVLIHCAAAVHSMDDIWNETDYIRKNVFATKSLLEKAALKGLKRFIYISSIKVNGEHTVTGQVFSESDAPNPQDAYGRSKLAAEQEITKLCLELGIEYVIIRPPLVYDIMAKGNIASLRRLIEKGLPIPLGGIKNHRSIISLHNLVTVIEKSVIVPAAANQIFTVSDSKDISTCDLVYKIGQDLNVRVIVVKIPVSLVHLLLKILNKDSIGQRLFGDLRVCNKKVRKVLDWDPE